MSYQTFDFSDICLAVANYFAQKQQNCIQLTIEEGEKIFGQPFNMVTVDEKGTTDGILILQYEELLDEVAENDHSPLKSGMGIQNTWVCLDKSMLEFCLPKLDEFTGILIYKRVSEQGYNISEYRKAEKMHDYPHPADTLSELLNIQAKRYWWLENYRRTERIIMQEMDDLNI